jgi:hypothetical protein
MPSSTTKAAPAREEKGQKDKLEAANKQGARPKKRKKRSANQQ